MTGDVAPAGCAYRGAWHAAADWLTACGVREVIGLPDDDLGLLRALVDSDIRFVSCRDQRNAVFMTAGRAVQSGALGVCVLGKGPAITNAATGVAEAAHSHVPLVLLASGTAVGRRGSGAFQEMDQIAVVRPLVKWAVRVDHPERVVPALERAAAVATSGAAGPVYVELADHLQESEVLRTREWAPVPERAESRASGDSAALHRVRASSRPVLLVGGGMRHRDPAVLERFAELTGAAVFCTASGRGVVDEHHEQFCGLAGLYARPATEELWRTADLVVAVGTRLEETATTGWQSWGVTAEVLQINVEAAEFSCEFPGPRVLGDAIGVLGGWIGELGGNARDADWVERIVKVRAALWTEPRPARQAAGCVAVMDVLDAVQSAFPHDRVLVQENGLQDMWSYVYPYYSVGRSGGSVVPSEQTALGFGAGAAAGVKLAAPERPVVALVGDGAFGLFQPELPTLAREGIGVVYVVLHNGGYGWLQHQLGVHGLEGSGWSFADDGSRSPARSDVAEIEVEPGSDLPADFGRAWELSERGSVVVVHVPVSISDTPTGILPEPDPGERSP